MSRTQMTNLLSKDEALAVLSTARERRLEVGSIYRDATFGPRASETWLRPEELQFDGERQIKGIEINKRESWKVFRRQNSSVRDATNLGHAWLTSTALALAAISPNVIDTLFVERDEDVGCHVVKLRVPEGVRYVVIDDRFPTLGDGANSAWRLRYASCDKRQLWLPLVEKAVAKVRGGYEALSQRPCSTANALTMLTGKPVETLSWADPFEGGFESEELWSALCGAKERGVLAFLTGAPGREAADLGVAAGHAYAVVDVREERLGGKCVAIANHHRGRELKGMATMTVGNTTFAAADKKDDDDDDKKKGEEVPPPPPVAAVMRLDDVVMAFRSLHSLAYGDDWSQTTTVNQKSQGTSDVFLLTVTKTTSIVADLRIKGPPSAVVSVAAAMVIKPDDKEAFSDDGGSKWTVLHGNETVVAATAGGTSSSSSLDVRHLTVKCDLHHDEGGPAGENTTKTTKKKSKSASKAKKGTCYILAPVVVETTPSSTSSAAAKDPQTAAAAGSSGSAVMSLFVASKTTKVGVGTVPASAQTHRLAAQCWARHEAKAAQLAKGDGTLYVKSDKSGRYVLLGENHEEKKALRVKITFDTLRGCDLSRDYKPPKPVAKKKLEKKPSLLRRMGSRKASLKDQPDDDDTTAEKKNDDDEKSPDDDDDDAPPTVISTIPPKSAALVCVAVPQPDAARYAYSTSKQLAFLTPEEYDATKKKFDPPLPCGPEDDLHAPLPLATLATAVRDVVVHHRQPEFAF